MLTDSSSQAATSSIDHTGGALRMACPPWSVQALTEPSHQFALDEVQPFVGLVDHEDVLLAPAIAFNFFGIDRLWNQSSQCTAVGVVGDFHDRLTAPTLAGRFSISAGYFLGRVIGSAVATTSRDAGEIDHDFHRPHRPKPVG